MEHLRKNKKIKLAHLVTHVDIVLRQKKSYIVISLNITIGFFAMVLFGLISKGLEAKEVTLTKTPIDWLFVVSGNVFCQMMIERILLANGIIVKGILFLVFPGIIMMTVLIGLVRKFLLCHSKLHR